MKPEKRIIDLMRYASLGYKVAIIGENMPCTHVEVGDGIIYFRNHQKSQLMSIRVDTVWFMEYPVPEEVERLGLHMTWLSTESRVIKGTHES